MNSISYKQLESNLDSGTYSVEMSTGGSFQLTILNLIDFIYLEEDLWDCVERPEDLEAAKLKEDSYPEEDLYSSSTGFGETFFSKPQLRRRRSTRSFNRTKKESDSKIKRFKAVQTDRRIKELELELLFEESDS
ncbi:MAG: hypothetical protein ACRCXZ_09315 [Patescibacteria group bacterium]